MQELKQHELVIESEFTDKTLMVFLLARKLDVKRTHKLLKKHIVSFPRESLNFSDCGDVETLQKARILEKMDYS